MPSDIPPVDRSLVQRLADRTVVVIGDVMLDQFLVGRVNRISPEAPVPVVEFDHDEFRLGGAANVAHNIRALGGRPVLIGLAGRDEAYERICAELKAASISADGLIVDETRPTTRKLRIVTNRRQQVARVDYEADREAAGEAEAALISAAEAAMADADVVVVSDYLKGVVTRGVMRAIGIRARAKGVCVLVDPKIPHLSYYAGATVITPNHYEAEIATRRRIRTAGDAARAARAFRLVARCQSVMITRGEQGLWLLEASRPPAPDAAAAATVVALVEEAGEPGYVPPILSTGPLSPSAALPSDPDILHELSLPAVAREVSDVTGAGDTVIATLALGLAAGSSLTAAAELANHAAGIAVARFGPTAVTQADLLQVSES